jgi:thiol-disulfide isomerase/thioredoxin
MIMKKLITALLYLTFAFNIVQAQQKVVLIEEGTGTWCQYCPRGDVYAQELQKKYPGQFVFVSIHFGDPMEYIAYSDAMPFSGLPSAWLNRNTITELKPFETLKQDMETQLAKTPPASIDVKTNWNDSNRELKMDVVANFTQPLSGDYRLAAIVVESGVTGNTPGYNQVNAYSGGAFGEMGGYENLPDPIPSSIVTYNHVARYLAGGINGDSSSLPINISAGETHQYSYTYKVPEDYEDDYIRVIGVLVNVATGEVLNAVISDYIEGYANGKPFFQSSPKKMGFLGSQYEYDIVAHDPDYDALKITAVGSLPQGLSLTDLGNGNARISGVPTTLGTYKIELELKDGTWTETQDYDLIVGNSEGDWVQVGQKGINGFAPAVVDMEMTKDGVPFVMASNFSKSIISVYELKDDKWIKLGKDIDGDAYQACMTMGEKEPVVFSNGIASKWDGTQWNQMGDKIPGDYYIFPDIIRAGDGTYFTVFFAPSDNQTHTYQYDGSAWKFVGDVADKYTVWNRLKLDRKGNPLIIYGIDGVNIAYSQASLWEGGKWNVLGQGHIDTVQTYFDHDIAMDKNGDIYAVLTYGQTDQFLNVYELDQDDKKWELEKFNLSGGASGRCEIEGDDQGNIFVAYRDESNSGKTSVQKYDGEEWSFVGNPGFTEIAKEQNLIIDPKGVPYVAYTDASLRNQVNVKKYEAITSAIQVTSKADYNLKMYPNPTHGNLFIQTSKADSYQVFNTFGQQLKSGRLTRFKDVEYSSVDLSNLPSGVYYIFISGQYGVQTGKVILLK